MCLSDLDRGGAPSLLISDLQALNKRPSVVDLVPLSLYEDEGSSAPSTPLQPLAHHPVSSSLPSDSSRPPRHLFERLLSSTGASAPWSSLMGSSSSLLSGAVRCGGSSLPEGHQSLFFSWTETPEDLDVTDGRPHSFGIRSVWKQSPVLLRLSHVMCQ